MDTGSQYILSSLDHALDVLNLFFEHEELSAATAARELGVSRTAAFRMLYTLEAKGCLTRTPEGAYRLGIKLFSLGRAGAEPHGADRTCAPASDASGG